MWLILGIIAIIGTLLNLYLYHTGKDFRLAMAIALSFTALTLNAHNHDIAQWVIAEDWTALLDVAPTMASALWVLTIISILLNITPLLIDLKKKK